jgi:hypothetical protein
MEPNSFKNYSNRSSVVNIVNTSRMTMNKPPSGRSRQSSFLKENNSDLKGPETMIRQK